MKDLKDFIVIKHTKDPNRTAIHTTISKKVRDTLREYAHINISATFENFLIALVEELKEEEGK